MFIHFHSFSFIFIHFPLLFLFFSFTRFTAFRSPFGLVLLDHHALFTTQFGQSVIPFQSRVRLPKET